MRGIKTEDNLNIEVNQDESLLNCTTLTESHNDIGKIAKHLNIIKYTEHNLSS